MNIEFLIPVLFLILNEFVLFIYLFILTMFYPPSHELKNNEQEICFNYFIIFIN